MLRTECMVQRGSTMADHNNNNNNNKALFFEVTQIRKKI